MSAERLPWFKCNPGKLLGAMAGLTADENLTYITILLRIYETGGPIPDDAKRLARRCGMTEKRVQAALDSLLDASKITIENGTIDSDSTHETLEDMKAVKKSAKNAGIASAEKNREKTQQNQTQISTGVERSLNERQTGVQPYKIEDNRLSPNGESSAQAREKPGSKKGTRLPEDWSPKESDMARAEQSLGKSWAERELVKFRDHWRSAPGAKGVKQDWDATWRNWIARAEENGIGRRGNSNVPALISPPQPPDPDRDDARARGWLENYCLTKTWKYWTFSGEPGTSGCKIKPEILEEFRERMPMFARNKLWPSSTDLSGLNASTSSNASAGSGTGQGRAEESYLERTGFGA
jgi:uncharacterized protein YdaU (DUF1376 family)